MKASEIFREKRILENLNQRDEFGIAEIKIWEVPASRFYPDGKKFSLFCVFNGKVILGIDNHKPKGPRLHLGDVEVIYNFVSVDSLLLDFWELVRKAGFKA